MVAELVPKTCETRPPFSGGPPKTTFDGDPGDGERDMLIVISDQVERLIRQSRFVADTDREQILLYVNLLDIREKWVLDEWAVEAAIHGAVCTPLGLPEDPYDLALLFNEDRTPRRASYQRLLHVIREGKRELLDRLGDPISGFIPS